MVLALPAVGLATVDGALAGGAALGHGAVGAVGRAGGAFLLVVFACLCVGEGGGEGHAHEEGEAEDGELHGVWVVGIGSEKVILIVLLGCSGALDWRMVKKKTR